MIRKKNEHFQNVGEILPRAIRHLHKSKQYKLYLLRFYWPQIVGVDLAERTLAHELEFGRLTLMVADSGLAANLVYMKLEIIEKINTYFKYNFVKEINFIYGPISQSKYPKRIKEQYRLRDLLQQVELPAEVQQQVEATLKKAEDPEIIEAGRKMLTAAAKIKKLKKDKEWHACAACGVLCPPQEKYCPECQRQQYHQKRAAIREILLVKPWIRYAEIKRYIDCTQDEVAKERVALVQRLATQLNVDTPNDIQLKSLVMLYRALPPEQLTRKVVAENLRRLKYDLNYNEMLKLERKKGNK